MNRWQRLRETSLPDVLERFGAQRDRWDRRKWHTPRGVLSISGEKFFNWNRDQGGGGAIDLVMHLKGCRFQEAVRWLEDLGPTARIELPLPNPALRMSDPLLLPEPQAAKLHRIKDYLIGQRCLPSAPIESLIKQGTLYADRRANAVFLLRCPETANPVGAELRGTSDRPWRAMAPGTRKDAGFFCVPVRRPIPLASPILLCESAIDAISASVLFPKATCLSTSGARANPTWLKHLIHKHSSIQCAFDADPTGEVIAKFIIQRYPTVQRLRPPLKDWNDTLRASL